MFEGPITGKVFQDRGGLSEDVFGREVIYEF